MKRITLFEHSLIARGGQPNIVGAISIESRLYDRLRRFDDRRGGGADRVFDWRDGMARAQQWVGVIEVRGLQIEILPKLDAKGWRDGATRTYRIRDNLIYMLAMAGKIPMLRWDFAHLSERRAPVPEVLAATFATRLHEELTCGLERAYLRREENLQNVKGRILTSKQVVRNAVHRERFYCRYDDFSIDTTLNRILRRACMVLRGRPLSLKTLNVLRHCAMLLDGVSDFPVQDHHFDEVTFTRQNERFADLFRFSRLILQGKLASPTAGVARSYSLLFDMNVVFESFVAAFLRSKVMPKLPGCALYQQSRMRRKHLLRSNRGRALSLRPDLLIEGPQSQQLVMDTKWKLLSSHQIRNGMSVGDVYQALAYAKRYGCAWTFLLYPRVAGVEPTDYDVIGPSEMPSGERIGIRLVNLHRDLRKSSERRKLAEELAEVVRCGITR